MQVNTVQVVIVVMAANDSVAAQLTRDGIDVDIGRVTAVVEHVLTVVFVDNYSVIATYHHHLTTTTTTVITIIEAIIIVGIYNNIPEVMIILRRR